VAARVALLRHPDCAGHDPGPHPESGGRLAVIDRGLEQSGLMPRLLQPPVRRAERVDLLRVHEAGMVDAVEEACRNAPAFLDPDTPVSTSSCAAALAAAGAGLTAADGILSGEYERAFCCVRPPGHHAGRGRSAGFCLFNNIAVAAAYLLDRQQVGRILIVDFDVHHGNGTQEIFYDTDRVFYLSAHLIHHYPYLSGYEDERGNGPGKGFNRNLAFRAGTSAEAYLEAVAEAVRATAADYGPDFVLVSAGFDSHRGDPLGGVQLEAEDFGSLTRVIVESTESARARGPISFLEGGYTLSALAESVNAHLRALF